jgi:hypothetical protein
MGDHGGTLMKKLLLTAALCALAAPAYATINFCPNSGSFCFNATDTKEELEMFNDIANKDTVGPFFGSVHGNGQPQFTPDITVKTNADVTTGSGNANIKDGDNNDWTLATFTVNPMATNAKTGTTVKNALDGFFMPGQLEDTGAKSLKDGTFTITVNAGLKNEASWTFTEKFNADFQAVGFDEPLLPGGGDNDALAALVKTVTVTAGPNTAFFEMKQIDWSPDAISGVPELSTWAMMLLGFAGLGYAGFRQTRKSPRFAI